MPSNLSRSRKYGNRINTHPVVTNIKEVSSTLRGQNKESQEAQLSLRDRATRACQLKSGKVLHKCRRLVFEKL